MYFLVPCLLTRTAKQFATICLAQIAHALRWQLDLLPRAGDDKSSLPDVLSGYSEFDRWACMTVFSTWAVIH
jgi:hypothetical protein